MAANDVIVALRAAGQAAFKNAMDRSADSIGKVERAADDAGKSVDTSGKRAKDAGKGWKGAVGSLGGWTTVAAGAAAVGATLKTSTGAAVDLGEEVSKVGVVFGASAKPLQDWSKTTASALGVSHQAALEAAGTFGNMLVPMGIAKKDAADMSQKMVTLGADMASFNNASPEETLGALRSGLAGEAEPLRKFGVFLSDARVQAQALGMGLVKTTKDTSKIKATQLRAEVAQRKYNAAVKEHGKNSLEAKSALAAQATAESALGKATAGKVPQLTATQKAQASYALIMKDTAMQQGDVTRTSGSLANKQRVLKAQWTDLTATIGTAVLPIALKLAGVLGLMMKHTEIVIPVIATMAAAWLAYSIAQTAAAIAALSFNAAFLLIPIAIVAVVAAIVVAYKKVDWFRAGVRAAAGGVVAAFNWLKTAAVAAFRWVKTAASNTFAWIKRNWPLLLGILTGPIGLAVVTIARNWGKIKDGARGVLHWFRDFGGKLVSNIVEGIRSAPGAIIDAIKALLPGGKVGKKLLDALPGFATGGAARSSCSCRVARASRRCRRARARSRPRSAAARAGRPPRISISTDG
jgi:hypothetical protein